VSEPDLAALIAVPAGRVEPLRELRDRLLDARSVALTTHHNADGDGAGSEAAVAAWLGGEGVAVTIVNPTPFPDAFRFLLPRGVNVRDWGTEGSAEALAAADLLLVLDTSEPKRIAPVGDHVQPDRTLVIDHHPPGEARVSESGLLDPSAAATGELVYDLLRLDGATIPDAALVGIYVAILTDTGSFRFSNTSPRTHLLAADLIRSGVDPESVFRRIYATVPRRRAELLREALGTLRQEGPGISWMTVSARTIRDLGTTSEDLDGLVEHARALEGTEVALLLREMEDGTIKVSFRSNGETDVNRVARRFGGGGHVKASGATISGTMESVLARVVDAVGEAVEAKGG
jgi:bifunctional oligoribonuclease and PAP phosphatase NrnA